MADGAPEIKQLSSTSSSTATNPPNKKNPSKFYTHFVFKTLIISIFLAIIPLFPSESPDFGPPSIYTRGWELLYLIFVGVAVSYGLFSRRNPGELERENSPKFDSAHSYMSRLLQFPSIFDDDVETPSGSDSINNNNNSPVVSRFYGTWGDLDVTALPNNDKFQAWSSRYHRNEPMLVVAKRGSENSGVSDEKPLLLPVRSLKSRVSDDQNDVDSGVSRVYARSNSMPIVDGEFGSGEDYESSRVSNRSNSSVSSKGSSNDSRRLSKHGSLNPRISVPSEFGNVDEDDRVFNRSYSSVSSKGSSNESRRVSKHGSLSPRISVPSEFGYGNEDNGVSNISNSSVSSKGSSNESRRLSRYGSLNFPRVPKEFGYGNEDNGATGSLSRSSSFSRSSSRGSSSKDSKAKYGDFDDERMEEQEKKVVEGVVLSSPIPWQSRSWKRIEPKGDHSNDPITFSRLPSMAGVEPSQSFKSQSPRSSQSNSSFSSPTKLPSPPKRVSPTTTLSSESQAKNVEDLGRRNIIYSSRLPPPPPPPPPPPSNSRRGLVRLRSSSTWSEPNGMSRENRSNSLNIANEVVEEEEKVRNEVERTGEARRSRGFKEEHETKTTSGYDPMAKESFSEIPKETRDFLEGLLVETDDDSESDDNEDNYGESKDTVQTENLEDELPSSSITDEGPDVDKKADEFIAKFREQIRLQRIDSIKRSTGQLKRSSLG